MRLALCLLKDLHTGYAVKSSTYNRIKEGSTRSISAIDNEVWLTHSCKRHIMNITALTCQQTRQKATLATVDGERGAGKKQKIY